MKTPLDISALTPLVKALAAIARRLIGNVKPGISDIVSLVLADGGVIKEAVNSIKEVPAEFLDLDPEEGQALSALVQQELGQLAEGTNLDNVIGEIFVLVPAAKGNFDMLVHASSWETKGEAIGDLLCRAGRLIDLIHPPVARVVP
jgi:hypothetical protein